MPLSILRRCIVAYCIDKVFTCRKRRW